jgi:hypothetical protein
MHSEVLLNTSIIWLIWSVIAMNFGATIPETMNDRHAPPVSGRRPSCLAIHPFETGKSRDNSAPISSRRGGSAPARPQVKAAQPAANSSTRRSSSEFICASDPVSIRPIARRANSKAA